MPNINESIGKSGLSMRQRLENRVISRIEKNIDTKVDQKLQEGQSPNDIFSSFSATMQPTPDTGQLLAQIQQLAQTQVPSNERFGILPTLSQLMSGQFTPGGQKPSELGFGNAVQLMNMQQSMQNQAL